MLDVPQATEVRRPLFGTCAPRNQPGDPSPQAVPLGRPLPRVDGDLGAIELRAEGPERRASGREQQRGEQGQSAEESELFLRITSDDPDVKMPPAAVVEAGRLAFESGRIPRKLYASASTSDEFRIE